MSLPGWFVDPVRNMFRFSGPLHLGQQFGGEILLPGVGCLTASRSWGSSFNVIFLLVFLGFVSFSVFPPRFLLVFLSRVFFSLVFHGELLNLGDR